MKKQTFFTLTELIVVVLIFGALASIVMLNVSDMKSKSIGSSIGSSTRNLQTVVDKFALKHNGVYPTNVQPTLEQPQPIEFAYLYPYYIKNKVDYQKIKNQLYWVDSFGQVWGATENSPNVVQTDKNLEWSTHKNIQKYNVYQVLENKVTGATSKMKIKEMKPVEVKAGTEKIQLEHKNKQYLISTVDEHGLESAPAGLGNPDKELDPFTPIFGKTGTFYYEITSKEKMHFDLFQSLENKPEGTSIYYQFAVLEENPVAGAAGKTNLQYGKFVNDFYSLPSSKGIKVKIIMNGANGKNPSIYDLKVLYHFELEEGDGELPPFLPELSPPSDGFAPLPEINYPPESDSPETEDGTVGEGGSGGQTGQEGEASSELYAPIPPSNPQPSSTGPKPPVLGGEVSPPQGIVCGEGFTSSYNINGYGDVVDTSKDAFLVYKFKLAEGQYISDIKIQYLNPEYKPTNIWYEYSHNGGSYKRAESVSSIPAPSCVSVVYYIKANDLFSPVPPIIDKQTSPLVLQPEVVSNPESTEENNPSTPTTPTNPTVPNVPEAPSDSYGPRPSDPDINSIEWVTVDEFQFFAGSQNGEKTDWLYSEIKDKKPEHTRILYYYATSNNGKEWSPYLRSFSSLPDSIYAKAYAVLQVEKEYLGKVEEPSIESVKLVNAYGGIDLDLVTPTVVLIPTKSNNQNSEFFSTTTIINWDYIAIDPLDKKIVEVKWSGDKRNQYTTPGKYTVQLAVKNELNYWSKPATFTFEVKEEKPVAQITVKAKYIMEGMPIEWSSDTSYDPDGDGIEKVEWAGDKRNEYDKAGNYTVQLRVQDKEGNWSDWTSKTIVVKEKEFIVQRLEAEETIGTKVGYQLAGRCAYSINSYAFNYTGSEYSNGSSKYVRGVDCSDVYEEFTFTGSGFDLKFIYVTKNVTLSIDGGTPISLDEGRDYTHSVRNLPNTTHTVRVTSKLDTKYYAIIDYLDVININTEPTIKDVYSRQINSEDIENPVNNNSIVPSSNLKGKTYFTLYKNSYVTATVKQNDKIIKTLLYNEYKEGGSFPVHSVIWDGKNSSGETVSTGNYDIVFTATGLSLKEQTSYTHTVFVDNNKPTQRLEAEGKVGTKVGYQLEGRCAYSINSYAFDYNSSEYSNGSSKYVRGVDCSNVYEEFTFNGTGFDLVIPFLTKNVELSIDGGSAISLPESKNYNHSIRNLSNTTHTVRVTSKLDTKYYAIIDYLDVYSSDTKPSFANVYARQLDMEGTESLTDNNSFSPRTGQQTKIYYTLDKNSYVTIKVKDSNGEYIKELTTDTYLKGGTDGNQSIVWNGKNETENHISSGWYIVEITAKGIYKDVETIHNASIYVDNNLPIQRLEAEGTVGTKVGYQLAGRCAYSINSYAFDYNSSEYSNGSSKYVRGVDCSNVYEEFTFNGTGFDLKIPFLTENVELSIDGGSAISLPKATNYTYSARNLSNTSHTVRVTSKLDTKYYAIIDYLDVISSDTKPNFLNVYARQLDSEGNETLVNNSAINPSIGQKTKVYYTLDKDSYITIKVKNTGGDIVKNLASDIFQKGGSDGNQIIVWDGLDNNGRHIPTGLYTVEIVAQGIYKDTPNIHTVSIFVDNNKPIQRLEAEGTVGTKVGYQLAGRCAYSINSYAFDYNSSEYSNGSSKYVRGVDCSNVYEEFTFTGTGFDLRIPFLTENVVLSVDGGSEIILPKTRNYTYSIRNLANTSHTVRITSKLDTKYYAIIDYLDVYSSDTKPNFTNVFPRQLDSDNNETLVNNNSISPRIGQKTKVYYTLDKNSYITIKVKNSSGEEVKSWTPDVFEKGGTDGNHYTIWDGKNNSGGDIQTGWYKVEITAKGIYKDRETIQEVPIFVDNSIHSQRLEAEGTVGTKVGYQLAGRCAYSINSYAFDYNSSEYSNGSSKYVRGVDCSNVYEEFTFTGTGFDLRIPFLTENVVLSIDGGSEIILPKTRNYTYSIRNLSNANHTVRITSKLDTKYYAIIDYLDIYK